MQPPRRRLDLKVSTFLGLLTTVLLFIYYLCGLNAVPQAILLPVAGQVLAVGIRSTSTIIFDVLSRATALGDLPLDALTPFLIGIDTHFSGVFTPERLLIAPAVKLLMEHTPETLLGTLASGKPDIRSVGTRRQRVQLAAFGGAADRKTYYTSGQVLLSSTDPDSVYSEIAYRSPHGDWVVPRKPTIWYHVFRRQLLRDNDAEKRIHVPDNDAVILVPIPALPPACETRNISDFGVWLALHTCSSYIGFSFGGHLPPQHGFYQLHRGTVEADYESRSGKRFVSGGLPFDMEPVSIPRVEQLWDNMAKCFLNAISFNRPPADISVPDKLVLSSLVRIAGLDHYSGFSSPPAMVEAFVTDVVNTNLSRWVVLTIFLAMLAEVVRVAWFRFHVVLLVPELENLAAALRDVPGVSSVARYARGSRGLRNRVCGRVERDEHGGGRFVVPGGLDGKDTRDEGTEVD